MEVLGSSLGTPGGRISKDSQGFDFFSELSVGREIVRLLSPGGDRQGL